MCEGHGIKGSLYSLSLACQVLGAENLSNLLSHFGLQIIEELSELIEFRGLLGKASCGHPETKEESVSKTALDKQKYLWKRFGELRVSLLWPYPVPEQTGQWRQ